MSNGQAVTPGATRMERVGEIASRAASLKPDDPSVRRALYAVIGLVVALSIGLVAWSSFTELPGVDWRYQPGWIALAIASMLLIIIVNALVWTRLLLALGPEIETRRGVAIWCVSALGRYVPTSRMMPVMRAAMAEGTGVPKRITLASVVYELALVLTGVLIVGSFFVVELPDLAGNPARFLVLALPVMALILLQPRIFRRVTDAVLSRLGRRSLPTVLSTATVLRFSAAYAGLAVLGGVCVYALAHLVHPVDGGDAAILIGAFSVGTALSILTFVLPSGLIAREAGLTLALAPVMAAAPAIALAVLLRILQLGSELLLALGTMLLVWRRQGSRPPTGIRTRSG